MVERDEERARVALHVVKGLEHLFAARRGEDVAGDAHIEHALADETVHGRFVSGAAERDECDLVGGLRGLAHDDLLVHERKRVAIAPDETFQKLLGKVRGIVDELLHGHGGFSVDIKSPLRGFK